MPLSTYLQKSPLTLLYFYPKDDTPGCTLEAQDFTRLKSEFGALGIQIIGVSQDSDESHESFRAKCDLGIELIADTMGDLHREFDVIGEKNMYGKKIIGVIRSTFLLDPSGTIIREWRNVRATGHAARVLRELL